MTAQPSTRQELYDRIRESSKDEVILDEMIRLGFWPATSDAPHDPAEEIRRRGELERQLRALVTEKARLHNVEAMKKAVRQPRMKEARERRQETKRKKLQQREERKKRWQERKQREITYLGSGVSAGLNHRETDEAKLSRTGLPVIRTEEQLAKAMDVTVGELRFLAFARRTSPTTHYVRFTIPKKSGGLRLISAPMPRLKRAQEWILRNILDQVDLHEAAHGFRPGRSIVTNAEPHVGAEVVVNVDLEDFFPTVTYSRIKGVFRTLGYSESTATILSLICSQPRIETVALDGQTWHVARSERFLPQGAPTSPAITNIICRGMDGRLTHLAGKLGFHYSRYADDLTFSGGPASKENVGRLLRRLQFIVDKEGFRVHPRKTRILHRGRRQEVTGLVVNDRVNVPRSTLRKFRAVLFQIQRDGPAGKQWGSGGNVIEAIEGFANFVAMVDAEKGRQFQQQVQGIIEQHGRGGGQTRAQRRRWQSPAATPEASVAAESAAKTPVIAAAAPSKSQPPPAEAKKKPWWKFW